MKESAMEVIWNAVRDALGLLLHADLPTFRIVGLSLIVSGLATALAALVGVPLGTLLAMRRFPGHRFLTTLVNTGMGLPPVVVGLVVALLLWRSGPLGWLGLIYTPTAMIVAQWMVAMPLAAGLTAAAIGLLDREVVSALRVDGASEVQVGWELIRIARTQVLIAIAAAFGRAISEVGASLMVGGNILSATRVLNKAITLETSRGDFDHAIALGIILLLLALLVNSALGWGTHREGSTLR
jgi:ABC-type tungstate transport system substrate-binding protein